MTLIASTLNYFFVGKDNILVVWRFTDMDQLTAGQMSEPISLTFPDTITLLTGYRDRDCCFVACGSKLYACGEGGHGQLGQGDLKDRLSPVEVKLPLSETITHLAATMFSCYVACGRQLFAWGNNHVGQLGVGDKLAKLKPTKVPLPFQRPITHLATFMHTLIIASESQLYVAGFDTYTNIRLATIIFAC